jgi:hypothetical protein
VLSRGNRVRLTRIQVKLVAPGDSCRGGSLKCGYGPQHTATGGGEGCGRTKVLGWDGRDERKESKFEAEKCVYLGNIGWSWVGRGGVKCFLLMNDRFVMSKAHYELLLPEQQFQAPRLMHSTNESNNIFEDTETFARTLTHTLILFASEALKIAEALDQGNAYHFSR